MIEFLWAFFIWLGIFIPSSIVASFVAMRDEKKASFTMQIALLILSFLVFLALHLFTGFNIVFSPVYILPAVLFGFLFGLVVNYLEIKIVGEGESLEFLPSSNVQKSILLLILAPVSEEFLNRGLIEGIILQSGYFWSAIIFSALIFGLPHYVALKNMKVIQRSFITISSIIMGFFAGFLFAIGYSIIPAILFHSFSNFGALVFLFWNRKIKL